MDAAKIAAAVVAACNGLENSPVQAETSGDSGKIIFSSMYKGSAGNKNTLKIESLASGVTRGRWKHHLTNLIDCPPATRLLLANAR